MPEEELWGRHVFTQPVAGSNRIEVWVSEDGTETVAKVYDSASELIDTQRFSVDDSEELNTYVQSFLIEDTTVDVEEPPEDDERWYEADNFDWDSSGLED